MFATRSRLAVSVVGFALVAGQAFAADIGTAFTYQGYVEKPAGTPLDDTCNFRFQLYDAAAGGSLVGANPSDSLGVGVVGGGFTTGVDFGSDAFNGEARWLEIQVQCTGDADFVLLAPRVELTPAPHAARAVSGVGGPFALNVTSANRVGIGTTSPESRLHVFNGAAGAVTANANSAAVLEGTFHTYLTLLTPASLMGTRVERGILFGDQGDNARGGIIYNPASGSGPDDSMQFRTGGNATRMTIDSAGKVGIGTSSPADETRLHVQVGSDGIGVLTDVGGAPGSRIGLRTSTGGWAELVKNAYYDLGGGTGWNRFDDARGAFVQEVDPDGNVMFGVAEAGSGTITWNNSLWLDKSGTVGMGTNAPTARLDVVEPGTLQPAITGTVTAPSSIQAAMAGSNTVTDGSGVGVEGRGGFIGVFGRATADGAALYYGISGIASGGSGTNNGVRGTASSGTTNYGLYGQATNGTTAYGVFGQATGGTTGYGVYGAAIGGGTSWAGFFSGNVNVTGTLSKGAGAFKIDHPLDPENKYLYHSFVESPDMKNIYDGVVTLGADGTASVELPDWFEALNRDFRYQLTCVGGFAPVYISQEVSENRFRIAGGTPGLKVSWTVTGIRQDSYANAHRIPVEEMKLTKDRGKFLHPELFGMPDEAAIDAVPRDKLDRASVGAGGSPAVVDGKTMGGGQ